MDQIKIIPYGVSSFADLRTSNMYYIDKTMYIPELEQVRFAFLLRPRRFGKSLFTAMLHAYYDVNYAERFDELFKDTWIHANPTSDRGKYLCLKFDFSRINQETDDVQAAFNWYCRHRIGVFVNDYQDILSASIIAEIQAAETAHDQLLIIEKGLIQSGHKLFIFIDEYDNFTNNLLAEDGQKLYYEMTKGRGFFKQFFRNLKGLTSDNNNALQRLYITGVSPITMDDVSSGFNIGTNISLMPKFNSMLGFTEHDVSVMIDYYTSMGRFQLDKNETIEQLKIWYDNYMFSDKSKESVFNSTGVLSVMYFSMDSDSLPSSIIDENLRMDSSKLKHLVYHGTALNGNFDVLTAIINHNGTASSVNKSFPFNRLQETDNYISLLYFFGFLTFTGKTHKGKPFLAVPNETIKHLVYEYLRSIIKESIKINNWFYELDKLSSNLAYDGDYQTILNYIAKLINEQTTIRDFKEGEEVIKTFHNIYLRVNDIYYTKTEQEMNKGFADIVLFPNYAQYPDIQYAYLIEIKYINKAIDPAQELDAKINKAKEQLEQYSKDHSSRKEYHLKPCGTVELKKLIVVYHGWDMIHFEEI